MVRLGLLVRLEAKPGREQEVERFDVLAAKLPAVVAGVAQ